MWRRCATDCREAEDRQVVDAQRPNAAMAKASSKSKTCQEPRTRGRLYSQVDYEELVKTARGASQERGEDSVKPRQRVFEERIEEVGEDRVGKVGEERVQELGEDRVKSS